MRHVVEEATTPVKQAAKRKEVELKDLDDDQHEQTMEAKGIEWINIVEANGGKGAMRIVPQEEASRDPEGARRPDHAERCQLTTLRQSLGDCSWELRQRICPGVKNFQQSQ